MFSICEIQQNLYACKYFYYCVHKCTLSELCQGEWHKKNHAEIYSLQRPGQGKHIVKQAEEMLHKRGGLT